MKFLNYFFFVFDHLHYTSPSRNSPSPQCYYAKPKNIMIRFLYALFGIIFNSVEEHERQKNTAVAQHVLPPDQRVFSQCCRTQRLQRTTPRESIPLHRSIDVISHFRKHTSFKERKRDYGVMISMKPSQLPIPTAEETVNPSPVLSNRNHSANAAKAITAYN